MSCFLLRLFAGEKESNKTGQLYWGGYRLQACNLVVRYWFNPDHRARLAPGECGQCAYSHPLITWLNSLGFAYHLENDAWVILISMEWGYEIVSGLRLSSKTCVLWFLLTPCFSNQIVFVTRAEYNVCRLYREMLDSCFSNLKQI